MLGVESDIGVERPPVVLECDPDTTVRINTDEALVPDYKLPDPLVFEDGTSVSDASQWPRRRSEIFELFEDHVFGRTPRRSVSIDVQEVESNDRALDGIAVRGQFRIMLSDAKPSPRWIDVLLYRPSGAHSPAPVFVVANFSGNHAVHKDPAIVVSQGAQRDVPDFTEERGGRASRFPVESIIQRGYAIATFYYGDVCPDLPGSFDAGAHLPFADNDSAERAPYEWGAVGAWAWSSSRVLDLLEMNPAIDAGRAIVGGHSRLGKAALWSGAQDERWAGVFANDSGCTGAALSRRRFGETVAAINTYFPHWFCQNYRCYSNNEDALPIDQHQLIALIAPRPVYIASATNDAWADPRGEFLAAKAAEPVYQLLGVPGLEVYDWPQPEEPSLSGNIGYHLRPGDHDLTAYDWNQYLDFADRHLGP